MDLKLISEPPPLKSIKIGVNPMEEETIAILGELVRE